MTLAPLIDAPTVIQIHACGDRRFRIRSRSANRTEGDDPAPPDRLVMGHADADRRGQLAFHPPDPLWGPWSPIHLLSILVLATLPLAVLHAHRHDVAQHRMAMLMLFTSALVIAGGFTFLPGRIMHAVVFSPS
jgi:uncharacterized membrane protein